MAFTEVARCPPSKLSVPPPAASSAPVFSGLPCLALQVRMGFSMPRSLTFRQMKFAAAVAGGSGQTAAYKEAGYAANGKPRTTVRNARQLAQKSQVQEAIREMRQQLLPDPGDVRDLYTHAMGVMVELSLHSQDDRVRYQASAWIREETGKQIAEQEKLKGAMRPASREEVLGELRKLFEQHLPERAPFIDQKPLVLEAAKEEAEA